MYKEKIKKILVKNYQGDLEITWHKESLVDPLPILLKLIWPVKKHGKPQPDGASFSYVRKNASQHFLPIISQWELSVTMETIFRPICHRKHKISQTIWASTWETLSLRCATMQGSNQSAQLQRKIEYGWKLSGLFLNSGFWDIESQPQNTE